MFVTWFDECFNEKLDFNMKRVMRNEYYQTNELGNLIKTLKKHRKTSTFCVFQKKKLLPQNRKSNKLAYLSRENVKASGLNPHKTSLLGYRTRRGAYTQIHKTKLSGIRTKRNLHEYTVGRALNSREILLVVI